jgi:hypothetical protein
VQQLREAFPESCPYRYAVLDRDGKFGEEVTAIDSIRGLAHVYCATGRREKALWFKETAVRIAQGFIDGDSVDPEVIQEM